MVRCIYCSRPIQKARDGYFHCVDKVSCDRVAATKSLPPKKVVIFFDAACQGANKAEGQQMGIGVHTTIDGVDAPEYSGIKAIGHGTVNDGEWTACTHAFDIARRVYSDNSGRVFITIFSDSQVVVKGFTGINKTGAKFLQYEKFCKSIARKLGAKFTGLYWISRDRNTKADILSKEALKLIK